MAKQAEVNDGGGDERPDNVAIKAGKREQKLTNQFNFNERSSQTLNNAPRVERTYELHFWFICLLFIAK